MATASAAHANAQVPAAVRRAFDFDGEVHVVRGGLINATFATRAHGAEWIVQRVNPIFAPENHLNIVAVTEHLRAAGVPTPLLRTTTEGAAYVRFEGETWRAMERIAGRAFDTVSDPAQALAAARFVAGWHEACASLDHSFVGTRVGVHDTSAHLTRLQLAIDEHSAHRLHPQVAVLGRELLAAARALPELPTLGLRVAHGDLKLNNLMFHNGPDIARPLALIDLDTVAPMQLAHELGDALRSWCNRATEDRPGARLDAHLAREVSLAYLEARGLAGEAEAREALLLGPEWISLELSARFLADAIFEDYFGWDPQAHQTRGDHNLARARGQWALYKAFADSRSTRRLV